MKWYTVEGTLKKIKYKLWIDKTSKNLLDGILIISFMSLGIIITSHFLPIVYLYKKIFYVSLVILIISIIKSILQKPTIKDAAHEGDKLGFDDRFITYIEFVNNDNEITKVFKDEVEIELQEYEGLKKFKYGFSIKRMFICFLVFITATIIYFIPNEYREKSVDMENINKDIKQQAKKLANSNNINANNNKNEIQKKELENAINNLQKKLDKTYNYEKAAEEVAKTEEKINNLRYSMSKEEFALVASLFNGTSLENSEVVQGISSGDMMALEKLQKNVEISTMDKEKLSKNLKAMENSNKLKNNEVVASLKDKVKDEKNNGADLQDKEEKSDEGKFNNKESVELEKAKEKFLAKSGRKGFKDMNGNEKTDSFALGERESFRNAEKSDMKQSDKVLGGDGDSSKEDNNAVGGSRVTVNNSIKEQANKGSIDKNHKGSKIIENKNVVSNVKGARNKNGSIYKKNIEEVLSENGNLESMQNKWLQYKEEKMNGFIKYSIPIDKRELVVEYFKQLDGGTEGGEH